MRIVFLPTFTTLVVDVGAWFLLHMGISLWLTRWDAKRFNPHGWLYLERRWERGGMLYKKVFKVQLWKKWLPDAAPWFKGGIAKKDLPSLSADSVQRFMVETCRGELTHWISMAVAPVFFFWNLPWVGGVMILYAVVANLPCIITQRFNRIRCSHLVIALSKSSIKPSSPVSTHHR